MAKAELSSLRGKFRGSMLGGLVGDCLGSPYQFENSLSSGSKLILQRSFDQMEVESLTGPLISYTDDSAMARSLAESLIEKKKLDTTDVAKRFVRSFFQEPNRGYGEGVITVFHKLRSNKFQDILSPAKEQFNGQGSWGNGSAMRITPLALFCKDDLVEQCRRQSEITHTHKLGIDGAILQAVAIQNLLTSSDCGELLDYLIDKMDQLETDVEELGLTEPKPYKVQLNLVKKLLMEDPHDDKVVQQLGNDVSALHSVPTAIFCFLRAQRPIQNIRADNRFRRAIQYAISLGGDTDTIASMTGALSGAYHGEEAIPPKFLERCEASSYFAELADKLYEASRSQ